MIYAFFFIFIFFEFFVSLQFFMAFVKVLITRVKNLFLEDRLDISLCPYLILRFCYRFQIS